jgi:hypothetical protein
MAKKGKRKGKDGELELAALAKECGFMARRGQQYKGAPDAPDVIIETPVPMHHEVKRTESFQLYAALSQAKEDAGPADIPVVWHRRNNSRWVCVIDARDMFSLLRIIRGEKDG